MIIALTACTTIKVDHNARTSLMKSPETSGVSQIEFHGTLANTQNVELASATFDPIFGGTALSTGLKYQNDLGTYLGGGMGIIENLDVFGEAALDAPFMLGVQWQILGESSLIRSPGFKLSALAALGYHSQTDDSSDVRVCTNSTTCSSPEKFSAKHEVFANWLGLSLGQRLNQFVLLYFAPTYYYEYTWGNLVRASNSSSYSFKNHSTQYSGSLGAEFIFGEIPDPKEHSSSVYLKVEGSVSRISGESGYGHTGSGVSLSLGFRI